MMGVKRYNLPGKGLLSYSGMSTFLGCPRKYAYRYIDHVEEESGDRSAMYRGTAFHKLVEFGGAVTDGDTLTQVDGNEYEAAKVKAAFSVYHAMETDGLLPKMNHREVRLLSDEHQYIGYVDMMGVDDDGKWRLGELKTTARFDALKWGTLSINTQIALYTAFAGEFAHEQFLDMNDLEGVSYRTVLLSAKRPLKPTNKRLGMETPDAYAARIAGDAKVFHAMVSPSEEARVSALQSFNAVKEAVHDLGGNSGKAIKNPGNCHSYGRACEYFEHCWKIKPFTDEHLDIIDDDVDGEG